MAVSWTTITNAQVAAGAGLTTSLVTALRDNPEGIAQRATGALKAFNVPYNYQEFTSSGTWTKPADAETGDIVIVELCAGGSGGRTANAPGNGGTGLLAMFDIDVLGGTETVVVGAGGTTGVDGGNSSFGTSGTAQYREVAGGGNPASDTPEVHIGATGAGTLADMDGGTLQFYGGIGGNNQLAEKHTIFGGGGGGGSLSSGTYYGGNSVYHGQGGTGVNGGDGEDGEFPGGGGGAGSLSVGTGGDGAVRVYCIKRN